MFYYVKPGCSAKTGKKEEDYFHGLDYISTDVAFCKRHNIELVLNDALPTPPQTSNSSKRKRAPAKASGVDSTNARSLVTANNNKERAKAITAVKKQQQPREGKSKPAAHSCEMNKTKKPLQKKKRTKKQFRELEEKRRRQLSSFTTIWTPPRREGNSSTPNCHSATINGDGESTRPDADSCDLEGI